MKKYNFQEYIGKQIGLITILDFKRTDDIPEFYTLCECGNKQWLNAYSVIKGAAISCGCFREIQLKLKCTKYISKDKRLYSIWREMKNRCYNEKRKDYKYYGFKGVKICEDWINDFNNFQAWALKNGYREKLTLDRIDASGNYEPENCRWVDMKIQNRNKSNNIKVLYKGETKTLKEWSEVLNINYGTLKDRYKKHQTLVLNK